KAPIPTGRGGIGVYGYNTGAGTSLDGKIATAGGVFNPVDTAGYVYDIATDTWSTYASLITARRNFGYTQYNGVLYALGGISGSGTTFLDTNEKLILSPAGAATPTPAVTATSVPPTATATPMATSTPVVTMTMTPVVTATATSA